MSEAEQSKPLTYKRNAGPAMRAGQVRVELLGDAPIGLHNSIPKWHKTGGIAYPGTIGEVICGWGEQVLVEIDRQIAVCEPENLRLISDTG